MGATYTGSIELRRLLIRWNRAPSGGTSEDAAACTIHFAKLTGGSVDSSWLTADYTDVEAAVDTFWTNNKIYWPGNISLGEYRWYKSGPAWEPIDRGDGPPNPAERVVSRSVVGTGTGMVLPPQVALSVTEIIDIRKRWGRFYLPAPCAAPAANATLTTEGRVGSSFQTAIRTAIVSMLNTCRAAGKQPVIWSRARSAYTTSAGQGIPAHAATAYEVTDIQIDNLWDVMRTRRYDGPTIRSRAALT